MICDFAQYYGCFDWRSLPVQTAAILCYGLPDDSRVKMDLSGAKAPYNTLLLAAIFDQVNIIRWFQTKDAQTGRNRPKPILADLLAKEEPETLLFDSGEAFMMAHRKAVEQCRH